jgi:DNA-binding MarR family transcriptional regulator
MTRDAPPDSIERLASLDRILHEPARLAIAACLSVVDRADFTFLLNQTGFTAGNLSSHLSRLEDVGYVEVTKQFVGKRPQTLLELTGAGREAFDEYRRTMRSVLEGMTDG